MKLVAAIAIVAAALVLPAAQAAPSKTFSPVLGLDLTKKGMHRLAWFSPGDLTMLHGRKAPLGRYVGTWVFSPDRSTLAVQAADTTGYQQQAESEVRLVNVRSMRRVGRIDLGSPRFWLLGWVRSDRLLALVFGDSGNFLAVVDLGTRRVVSRTPLTGPLERWVSLPNAVVLLLGRDGSFGPAVVAVVDAEGAMRTVTLDRISIGRVLGENLTFDVRSPGFTVDADGGRAFVVASDFTVGEVDLDSLRVAYHGGSTRSLAKEVTGPSRSAVWLGGHLLAVSGRDYSGDPTAGQPVGLRLIDTRDWRSRLLDSSIGSVWRDRGSPVFFAHGTSVAKAVDAYGLDGTRLYHLELADDEWLIPGGPYGYVCGTRKDRVLRVLDVRSGAPAIGLRGERPSCPYLLYGQSRL